MMRAYACELCASFFEFRLHERHALRMPIDGGSRSISTSFNQCTDKRRGAFRRLAP
jgi:hypothetical protein